MTFPTLKTGAAVQYPLAKIERFRNVAVKFVDGNDQRFRLQRSIRRIWVISLDALDDAEMAAVESFIRAQAGTAGEFSFTDPATGIVYPNCCLNEDYTTLEWAEIKQGRVTLTIRENWS